MNINVQIYTTRFALNILDIPTDVVPKTSHTYDVIVVGGGPGGIVFSYLAARAGLRVLLLEAYKDFNRQFRGDTLNPLAMGLLDEMGLMDEILKLPHSKADTVKAVGVEAIEAYKLTYSRMPSKFPYVMILAQPIFLNFMVSKASVYPNFSIQMQARVNGLISEPNDNGVVRGVRYKTNDGTSYEARAQLVIGADGRNSVVRELSGLETKTITRTTAMVVWFKVPLHEGDPVEGLVAREVEESTLFMFRRPDEWQVSLTLKNGVDYKAWRARGIEAMQADVVRMVPQFAERMETIEWKDTALLPVELKQAVKWYRDGVLLIGDAAHVMSPFGGIGINVAIRDAVIAANTLMKPLQERTVTERHLKRIQDRVAWEIRFVQGIQAAAQDSAPRPGEVIGLPTIARLILRIPVVRDLPIFLLSFGLVPVRVSRRLRASTPPAGRVQQVRYGRSD
jgi:2-polyprenyl-6-methoxyphenol hydroxylase-like FAD-dependent oxidoreductase